MDIMHAGDVVQMQNGVQYQVLESISGDMLERHIIRDGTGEIIERWYKRVTIVEENMANFDMLKDAGRTFSTLPPEEQPTEPPVKTEIGPISEESLTEEIIEVRAGYAYRIQKSMYTSWIEVEFVEIATSMVMFKLEEEFSDRDSAWAAVRTLRRVCMTNMVLVPEEKE